MNFGITSPINKKEIAEHFIPCSKRSNKSNCQQKLPYFTYTNTCIEEKDIIIQLGITVCRSRHLSFCKACNVHQHYACMAALSCCIGANQRYCRNIAGDIIAVCTNKKDGGLGHHRITGCGIPGQCTDADQLSSYTQPLYLDRHHSFTITAGANMVGMAVHCSIKSSPLNILSN
jgi:hypothetical protein